MSTDPDQAPQSRQYHIPIVVNPDAINEYVAKQIIESSLGERLHEAVGGALKSLGSYGNDPLKGAVISEVNKQVMALVSEEFAEQIRASVRAKMTDEYIDKLVDGFLHSVTARIDKSF